MNTRAALALVIAQLTLVAGSVDAQESYSRRTLEEYGRRIEAELVGEVEFTDDSRAVESVSPGGRFVMIEAAPGIPTRKVEIAPVNGGRLERRYSVNGAMQPLDATAESWLQTTLRELIRGTSTVSVADSRSSNTSRSSSSSSSVSVEPDDTPRCRCEEPGPR
jgi:hypothetical protein